jgi:hypothetical protein
MRLLKVDFNRLELDKLQIDEQVFFVQLAHLINELTILQKFVIFSVNIVKSSTGVRRTAQVIQTLFLIRTMAGKLNEGWQMMARSYFGSKLSQAYDNKLPDAAKNSLEELKKYFSKSNIINEIRNKYAFHYDNEKIKEVIRYIPNDYMQTMFISEHSGNCLFAFADTIINNSLLNAVNSADPHQAIDRLFEEIAVKVCRWFQDFGHGWVEAVCRELEFKSTTDIELQDVPSIGDIGLPYFVAEGKPIVSQTKTFRPFGLCAGEFTVPDDFDAPLPEDILRAFEGQ